MAQRAVNFRNPETNELHKLLEGIASRGQNMGRIFDDFLTAVVCCLALGTAEARYLEVAARYSAGEKGKRGIDIMATAFGVLVNAMEKSGADILGDFFEGAVTFGEHGQFFTPEPLCDLMAQLTDCGGAGMTVNDPACGSGRTLLAAARMNRSRIFVGQDVDERCVKMAAINLALNGLKGHVVWGNSLTLEEHGYYSVGLVAPGVVQFWKRRFRMMEIYSPGEGRPVVVEGAEPLKEEKASKKKTKQLTLFDAA